MCKKGIRRLAKKEKTRAIGRRQKKAEAGGWGCGRKRGSRNLVCYSELTVRCGAESQWLTRVIDIHVHKQIKPLTHTQHACARLDKCSRLCTPHNTQVQVCTYQTHTSRRMPGIGVRIVSFDLWCAAHTSKADDILWASCWENTSFHRLSLSPLRVLYSDFELCSRASAQQVLSDKVWVWNQKALLNRCWMFHYSSLNRAVVLELKYFP